jgi:hypothetical protein
MKNIQLQRVTLEQETKLKELGFVWEAQINVSDETFVVPNYTKIPVFIKDFPTIALALKWFRDEKQYRYEIKCEYTDTSVYPIYFFNIIMNRAEKVYYNTFEEVESALLDELLKIF